jgi:hypothetical protein
MKAKTSKPIPLSDIIDPALVERFVSGMEEPKEVGSGTFKIIRFYFDDDKDNEVTLTGLTLKEAKEHCSREDTHNTGPDVPMNKQWFDGFDEE